MKMAFVELNNSAGLTFEAGIQEDIKFASNQRIFKIFTIRSAAYLYR